MSPRAAWRLESLGFTEVYDYVDGKLDWMAAGLPTEGTNARVPRAGDLARRDVPTCRLDEGMSAVRERVTTAGWDSCVVVNHERVVLGLLRAEELSTAGDEPAEKAMRPGPSTFRPHDPVDEIAASLNRRHLASSPVTTSDGRLVGLLRVEDAERVAHETHEHAPAEGGQ